MAYAWSTLTASEADDKGRRKTFHPGEEVSAGDLGIDDEDFDELLASGAVREQEYPLTDPTDPRSPVEFVRDQLREAASEQFMQALPFGSVPPIQEKPPGSMPTVPMFDERAKEAVELTGFDPDKPAEEGQEPEKSEHDQQAEEAAAKKEQDDKAKAESAQATGQTPSAITNPGNPPPLPGN